MHTHGSAYHPKALPRPYQGRQDTAFRPGQQVSHTLLCNTSEVVVRLCDALRLSATYSSRRLAFALLSKAYRMCYRKKLSRHCGNSEHLVPPMGEQSPVSSLHANIESCKEEFQALGWGTSFAFRIAEALHLYND